MRVFFRCLSFPTACLCTIHCFALPLFAGFLSFGGVVSFSGSHGSHILAWLTALSMLPVATCTCIQRLRKRKHCCIYTFTLSLFGFFFILAGLLSLGFFTDTSLFSDILITSGSTLTIFSLYRPRKSKAIHSQ